MYRRKPQTVSEFEVSFDLPPPENGQFPIEKTDFDTSEYYLGDGRDVLEDMIASQYGGKYNGARLFIESLGEGGRLIANAEDTDEVNYLVGAALNPVTISRLITIDGEQRRSGRRLPLSRFGWGLTTQLVEFLQDHPNQAKPVAMNLRMQYLKLEDADDEDEKSNGVRRIIRRGIVEKLAKVSTNQDSRTRIPAQYLRSYIQPQIDFRNRILRGDLESVTPQIIGMEKLLAENKLRTGTSGSFHTLAYEFLSRAVEFQAERPDYPNAQKIDNMFKRIKTSGVDGAPVTNFDSVITLLNALQSAPEYGLSDYSLSALKKDKPQVFPRTIDRIMHIVTVSPAEAEASKPDLRTSTVRSLGHAARMFAEQAVKASEDGNVPLEFDDIRVRYPSLSENSHNALMELVARGVSSREIHAEARAYTQ